MPSTFCMWPTLSAVGRGHFVASPVWPNASGMAAMLAGDLELRDHFRVITDPPFVSYDSLPRGVRKSGTQFLTLTLTLTLTLALALASTLLVGLWPQTFY